MNTDNEYIIEYEEPPFEGIYIRVSMENDIPADIENDFISYKAAEQFIEDFLI